MKKDAPLQVFLMALMIQARHLFYGDKFKGMFLIFRCDRPTPKYIQYLGQMLLSIAGGTVCYMLLVFV